MLVNCNNKIDFVADFQKKNIKKNILKTIEMLNIYFTIKIHKTQKDDKLEITKVVIYKLILFTDPLKTSNTRHKNIMFELLWLVFKNLQNQKLI